MQFRSFFSILLFTKIHRFLFLRVYQFVFFLSNVYFTVSLDVYNELVFKLIPACKICFPVLEAIFFL